MQTLDLLSLAEVRLLLGGLSAKTIQRYRDVEWQEGIHYFKPRHKITYNRPLIEDWIKNRHSNPMAHHAAMEQWLKDNQRKVNVRKTG
jgi:Putative excisionase (DUF1233)